VRCLIVYGMGSVHTRAALAHYDGPWIALDLGYWDRRREDYALRVSVNSLHPDQHLDDFGPSRWDARQVEIEDTHDPDGHCLVAGMGRAHIRYTGQSSWDESAIARARKRWGNRVVYRPKPASKAVQQHSPIRKALQGCSYVLTHHSNVGVDAVLQGIPVASEQGAVRWLYPNRLDNRPADDSQRLDFLRRLAWWNWRTSEVSVFWKFLQERAHENPPWLRP